MNKFIITSIFIATIFIGCGENVTNKTTNNIPTDSVDNVPHPIPNPNQSQVNDKEFPPRPPSI